MNKFTKSMLTTGMRIVHRNGDVGIILKDIGCIAEEDGFCNLDDFAESLHYYDGYYREKEWDIVEVYEGFTLNTCVLNFQRLGKLLWKEKSEKDLKIEELEKTIEEAQKQLQELKEM